MNQTDRYIEDMNYYNDRRVRFRDPQHESWRLNEGRMEVYVTLPEWCPTHGEGEHDEHPECYVCKRIAAQWKIVSDAEARSKAEGISIKAAIAEAKGDQEPDAPTVDEVAVGFEWAVCPLCDGKGKHVNPSIDCGGITGEEFAEDPEFAESYFSGAYDVTCSECGGRRVVPSLKPRTEDEKRFVAAIDEIEEDAARDEAEDRRARAMGY